jgi:hypothetical protein
VKSPELAAKSTAQGFNSKMTSHALVASGWEDGAFSVMGTGSSLPDRALLAYRVLANDKKIVWALHEVSLESAQYTDHMRSINADENMNNHRLTILRSLKLR